MSGLTTVAERTRTAHADTVLRMIFDANRADAQRGIYSVCSAHRLVLEAAAGEALAERYHVAPRPALSPPSRRWRARRATTSRSRRR